MLIDPYSPDVERSLNQLHETLPLGSQIFLLVDGAFVPGIFRGVPAHQPILLFRDLPGLSEKAKDVSPFLVTYKPGDPAIVRLIRRCSGWPMLSAITTFESVEELCKRLSAWCIVEASGQRLNFRFPDTRRLPAIYEALTARQVAEMCGNSTEWRYIDRGGDWRALHLKPVLPALGITANAELDDRQFSRLVEDSAVDEIWVRLQYRGTYSHLAPSRRHLVLSAAVELAEQAGLDELSKLRWCAECMTVNSFDIDVISAKMAVWIAQNMGGENE
jgi:hypothetical protein